MSWASATWWQRDRVGEHVRAVAHRRHDEPVGIGELDPHRARQSPTRAHPSAVPGATSRGRSGRAARTGSRARRSRWRRARGSPRPRSATPTPSSSGYRHPPRPRRATARRRIALRSSTSARRRVRRCESVPGSSSLIARSSATSPSPTSLVIDRSERKFRTGNRLYNGLGPRCTTLHPAGGSWTSGIHGARLSITRITSASATHGAGSWPTYIGCSAEIAVATAQYWHTGIDHCSAMRASASKPAGDPAPRWATISGRSAPASSSAASAIWSGEATTDAARIVIGAVELVGRARLAQHLARQAEVDGPLGCRRGDRVRAVEQFGHLLGEAHLVLPLARLAHERGLVAHLLAPSDRDGPRSEPAALDGGCATRHQDHRDVIGRHVDRPDRAVGEPDVGVQDHGLGAAGREVVAVGHPHRDVLVRHDDGARHVDAVRLGLGQPFDDRREVGAGVDEHDVDAELAQPLEDRAARGDRQVVAHPDLRDHRRWRCRDGPRRG